jgi:hypothetical protein
MDNAFERTPQAETQIPRSLLGVIPDRAGTIKSGPSCSGERPKSCNLIENRQVVEACFDRQSVRVAGWYGNNDVARRAMERTRHSICWTRSFTRAWTLGTWRCRAAEGPSRAVNAHSRRLGVSRRRLNFCFDYCARRSDRQAPGDSLGTNYPARRRADPAAPAPGGDHRHRRFRLT